MLRIFSSPLDHATLPAAGYAAGRIFFGLTMALTHGMMKFPPPAMLVEGLGSMGLPLPTAMAWAASLSEVLGGLLIAAGLFTRPAALFLAITMAVAAFVAHGADPFAKKEMALLYLFSSIMFLAIGGGRFSVDALIARGVRK
jgi:putative oxidoreductase